MSFKCSVFGHRFGDPAVEREREEQGSEVVITITETETCERCGESRVVSENKEVTTLETPADIVGDEVDPDAGEASEAATGEAIQEAPETDPSTGPETEPESAIERAPSAREETASGELPEENVADDGVILEEETEESERAPGEWPEDDESDGEDWEPDIDDGELAPVEDEQPDIESTGSAVTVPEGEFHCPECEFTTPVESSSLREGDFCPECHRGSLTHRSGR